MNRSSLLHLFLAVTSVWYNVSAQTPTVPSIDPNELQELIAQKQQEAIIYLSKLVPVTKETILFAHTHADAIAREYEIAYAANERIEQALMSQTITLAKQMEALVMHFLNASASTTIQAWINQPTTQKYITQITKQWDAIEKLQENAYPKNTCPILYSVRQTITNALHTCFHDIWSFINTNAELAQQPIPQLSNQEKKEIIDNFSAGMQSLESGILLKSSSLQGNNEEKQVVLASIAILKDKTIIDALCSYIDNSSQPTDTLKCVEALIAICGDATVLQRASLVQFVEAIQIYNEHIATRQTALITAQQKKPATPAKKQSMKLGSMDIPFTPPTKR